MRTFFVSDYHYNHQNIIAYCKRPFKSLQEMNEALVRNHNVRVKSGDVVIHNGDFCFKNSKGGKVGEGAQEKAEDIIKKFNGTFVFVAGNHDKNNSLKTCIESLIIKYGNYRFKVVHDPKYVDYSYPFNFVGHVHGAWQFKTFVSPCGKKTDAINLGVDVWNFMPVTFEEILSKYSKWKRGNNGG
jgi:calcineurin-like phosphoesterase family protein